MTMSLGFRIVSSVLLLVQLAILPFVSAQSPEQSIQSPEQQSPQEQCVLSSELYIQYITSYRAYLRSIKEEGSQAPETQALQNTIQSILQAHCPNNAGQQVVSAGLSRECNNMLSAITLSQLPHFLRNNHDEQAQTLSGHLQTIIDGADCSAILGESAEVVLDIATGSIPGGVFSMGPVGINWDSNICFFDSGPAQGNFLSQIVNISDFNFIENINNSFNTTVPPITTHQQSGRNSENAITRFAKLLIGHRLDSLRQAAYHTVVLPFQALEVGSAVEDIVNNLGWSHLSDILTLYEKHMLSFDTYGLSREYNVMTSVVNAILSIDAWQDAVAFSVTPEWILDAVNTAHTVFVRDPIQEIFVLDSYSAAAMVPGLELIIPVTDIHDTLTLRIGTLSVFDWTADIDDGEGGPAIQQAWSITELVADLWVGQEQIAALERDATYESRGTNTLVSASGALQVGDYIFDVSIANTLGNIRDGRGATIGESQTLTIFIDPYGPIGCEPQIKISQRADSIADSNVSYTSSFGFEVNNTIFDIINITGSIRGAWDNVIEYRQIQSGARSSPTLSTLISGIDIKHQGLLRATLVPDGLSSWEFQFVGGVPNAMPLSLYRNPVQQDYTLISPAAERLVQWFIRTFLGQSDSDSQTGSLYEYFGREDSIPVLNELEYCIDSIGGTMSNYFSRPHPNSSGSWRMATTSLALCEYKIGASSCPDNFIYLTGDLIDVYVLASGRDTDTCDIGFGQGGSGDDEPEANMHPRPYEYFGPEATIPSLVELEYCVDERNGIMRNYLYMDSGLGRSVTTSPDLCQYKASMSGLPFDCQNTMYFTGDNMSVYILGSGRNHVICPQYTQNGTLAEPSDGDSEDPVLGCTDSTAINYNENATDDDGSCSYPEPSGPIVGCPDETATNYTPGADPDDAENWNYCIW